MKINKTKITITTLALAMGAALAGSISGSVAWYQYSTRATAQMAATSAGTSRNLQIRVKGETDWAQDIPDADFRAASSGNTNGNLVPVTAEGVAKNAALGDFYSHPVYQYFDMTESDGDEYIQSTFELQLLDTNHEEKDLYLETLNIRNTSTGSGAKDITDAVRIHFDVAGTGGIKFLVGNQASTTIGDYLDLNDDGFDDAPGFGGDEANAASKQKYGNEGTQTAYLPSEMEATFSDAYTVSGGESLGKVSDASVLELTITIWLEGWAELEGDSIWDEDFIGSSFAIDMRFQVVADKE